MPAASTQRKAGTSSNKKKGTAKKKRTRTPAERVKFQIVHKITFPVVSIEGGGYGGGNNGNGEVTKDGQWLEFKVRCQTIYIKEEDFKNILDVVTQDVKMPKLKGDGIKHELTHKVIFKFKSGRRNGSEMDGEVTKTTRSSKKEGTVPVIQFAMGRETSTDRYNRVNKAKVDIAVYKKLLEALDVEVEVTKKTQKKTTSKATAK